MLLLFSSNQSMLHPGGKYAREIADLWWLFFWVCTVVWILVVGFLLAGIFRKNRDSQQKRQTFAVGSAIVAMVLILFGLIYASASTGNELNRAIAKPELTIGVTGLQWWWKVDYIEPVPSRNFTTANEIRIPVGRPVELRLDSRDVIHSLWIPNLHGKRDLIPGHRSEFVIQADRPGVYQAQCAEFCGLQHAKMRLTVHAVSEEEFRAWAEAQRRPAKEPRTPLEQKGQTIFLTGTCATCHAILGTPAGGRTAPDLTHVGSRPMIAAGSLPNTRENMAAWIRDPQRWKPGNNMPAHPFAPDDLHALVAYLGSLK